MSNSISVLIELPQTIQKESFLTIVSIETTSFDICLMIKEATFFDNFNLSECYYFEIKGLNKYIIERESKIYQYLKNLPEPTLVFNRGLLAADICKEYYIIVLVNKGIQIDKKEQQNIQSGGIIKKENQSRIRIVDQQNNPGLDINKTQQKNEQNVIQIENTIHQVQPIQIGGDISLTSYLARFENQSDKSQQINQDISNTSSRVNPHQQLQQQEQSKVLQTNRTMNIEEQRNQFLQRPTLQVEQEYDNQSKSQLLQTQQLIDRSQELSQTQQQHQFLKKLENGNGDSIKFTLDHFAGSNRLDIIINNNRSTQYYSPSNSTLIHLEEYILKRYQFSSYIKILYVDSKCAEIQKDALCYQHQYIQAFVQFAVQQQEQLEIAGINFTEQIPIFYTAVIQQNQDQNKSNLIQSIYEMRCLLPFQTQSNLMKTRTWLVVEVYQHEIKILECTIDNDKNYSQMQIKNVFRELMQFSKIPTLEPGNNALKVKF